MVCVGSVWKSWDALKPGFLEVLDSADNQSLTEASLIRLKSSVASGATYLAAKTFGFHFTQNQSDTYKVLFHYVRNEKK